MEFFDKLGKKASEAYKATADKTGKIAKDTKIKLKIGELKTKVNDIYEDIGKRIYENHITNAEVLADDEIKDKCAKIDELSAEIDDLLKQSMSLRDKKQCPKCFTEMEKDVKFCPNCGEKQEIPAEPEVIEEVETTEEVKEAEVVDTEANEIEQEVVDPEVVEVIENEEKPIEEVQQEVVEEIKEETVQPEEENN